MKSFFKRFLACFLVMLFSISVAYADLPDIDLTTLMLEELTELKSMISDADDMYHDPSSSEESAVLDAAESVVEDYFSEQGIDISWAWVNYDYTQEWDFFTVSTHIDYRDADGKKHKPDVYAEVFRTDSEFEVYYAIVGESVIIDKRNDLPDPKWDIDSSGYMADSIGVDLRPLSSNDLAELIDAVDEEINHNHTPKSSVKSKIDSATKEYVNAHFEKLGITVEWPWFDYDYTCDWDYYTLTTRIKYRNSADKSVESPVYVEAYPIEEKYELVLLIIGDDTLIDNRSRLPENLPGQTNEATATKALATTPQPTVTPVTTPTPVPTPTPTPRPADAGELGETFTFGAYEQDNQTSNGTEPIEWRVIGTSGGKSLLLAEYALDRQPYNTSRSDVTWASSSLRKWLNDTFLKAAFSVEEQDIIQSMTLSTEDSYGTGSRFRAEGGKDTTDKVFVLSVDEVEGLRYDFSYLGFLNTTPTRYASSQGAYTDDSGSCWWWLRTPGASQSMAAISKDVQYQSVEIDDTGVVVDSPGTSVRPAIWVDTSALNAYLRPGSTNSAADSSEPTHIVLSRGSKGEGVKRLQERLIALGYLAGFADGDFGGKTESALIAYQMAAGLEATGVFDEVTEASIYSDEAPSPTPEPTIDPKSMVLKRGDKSEDVRLLQLRLIALGYLTGSADGDFGAKTEAALIAYQDRAGLPETGECDYSTFQSVSSASAPVAPTAAPTPKPTSKPVDNEDDYSGGTTYIGNKNTKKFHYSWCSSVDDMKEKNKVSLSSREAAISKGYVPCKRCDP